MGKIIKSPKYSKYYLEIASLIESLSDSEIADKIIKKHDLSHSSKRQIRDISKSMRSVHAESKDALLIECEKSGIDFNTINTNSPVWYKTKNLSIPFKPNQSSWMDIRKDVVREMNKYSPTYPKIKRRKIKDGHCLVVDPADIHVGKLSVDAIRANKEEVIERVIEGVEGLISKCSGFPVDQIVLMIGNDVLHVDNRRNTTTKGTPQDVTVTWHRAFLLAKDMYVEILERLVQIAKVHVMYSPSNHDYHSGFCLADTLKSWFRHQKDITWDISERHRKYFQYHSTMIESDHGDGHKVKDTGKIMAAEMPRMWADTKHRYSYKHHLHHERVLDDIGLTIHHVKSPSETDNWHDWKGYVGGVKAVQAFVHSKEGGRVATLTHSFV